MRNYSRFAVAAFAACVLLTTAPTFGQTPPATGLAGADSNHAAQADTGQTSRKRQRSTAPGTQIACTRVGCHPIPRGCQVVQEKYWDGTTTGFDAVVCPRR